jgi:hypothetical protein
VHLVGVYYKNISRCRVLWMSNRLHSIRPAFILMYLSFCPQIAYTYYLILRKMFFNSNIKRLVLQNKRISVRCETETQLLNTHYFIFRLQRVNLKRALVIFQFKHFVLETVSSLMAALQSELWFSFLIPVLFKCHKILFLKEASYFQTLRNVWNFLTCFTVK